MVAEALVTTALASYAFSRVTGLLGHLVDVLVGACAAAAGVLLTVGAPTRFGWGWQGARRHWRTILGTLAGAVAVVGAYRLLGQATPYEPS